MTVEQVLQQRLDPLLPARIQSALTPGEHVVSVHFSSLGHRSYMILTHGTGLLAVH